MREVTRRLPTDRPKLALRRTADGRLLPATDEADIADIWAEQKRIQLRQAMEEEKRRALKKQRRKERGLFGLRGRQTSGAMPAVRSTAAPAPGSQEIEIRLSLPRLRIAPIGRAVKLAAGRARRALASGPVLVCVVVAVLIVAVVGTRLWGGAGGGTHHKRGSNATHTAVLSANQPQSPEYDTVLPVGKTIEQLGGWGRVSPPDRDPVFAYSDTLASVHIVVSEQPLPADFASDLPGKLSRLAKQFNATKKLTTTEGSDVYVGTAANGSQSVVASKNGLLILIRSTSVIGDQIWTDYVYALE